MIVVSGTGRSGTSMWMQILDAAGVPIIGEAFPADWEAWIQGPNPRGYYESTLVDGIHFRTNPDPTTGARLVAQDTEGVAVKIFAAGVLSTSRVFLGRVLVSMRGWRAFGRSFADMQGRVAAHNGRSPRAARPSALRWWRDHHALLLDSEARGYALRFVAYDALIEDPERWVPELLHWLGVDGDEAAAVAAVVPALRRSPSTATVAEDGCIDGVPAELTPVLDEWYRRVRVGEPLDARLRAEMDAVDAALAPASPWPAASRWPRSSSDDADQ